MKIGNLQTGRFFKAADITRPIDLIIDNVELEQVGDREKYVVHFKNHQKALVLNRPNTEKLIEITKTDETDDWTGMKIRLCVKLVDFQGENVPAIRITDARRPQREQEDVPENEASF